MSEKDRNEAVEKIIGNMTAEMQNADGQYVPLGFSVPPSEPMNWNQASYNNYLYHNPEVPQMNYQYGNSYNYMPQFEYKNLYMYEHVQSEGDVYPNEYILNSNLMPNQQEPSVGSGHHIIENLVGNWVPTTTGTYSPFGNVEPFKPTAGVFEQVHEPDFEPNLEEKQFSFGPKRNKPRMVAEVKPMRPSYSDVLTKAVPSGTTNVKQIKSEIKEVKQKKENKKNGKSEKLQKNINLTRSNTNSEIKDIPLFAEKLNTFKNNNNNNNSGKEKCGVRGGPQLNRKWASMDDINEPINVVKDDVKKKKSEDVVKNLAPKSNLKKVNRNSQVENESSPVNKNESFVAKNGLKKPVKVNSKQKNADSSFDRLGKRNQRVRKRENNVFYGIAGQKLRQYLKGWWKMVTAFFFWFLHLISDICSLSVHISRYVASNVYNWSLVNWALFVDTLITIAKRIRLFTWIYEKFKKPEKATKQEPNKNFLHSGLPNNINMPTTGEEAMKRLLACKGKDPYSILGVTPSCTDDDIKRYYKRQAFLVHPDKNQQPGAEEAFKILVHAFDMIGEPERRAAYDQGVVESVQVEQAWSELTELLAQLQQKVEAAANTIRCSACSARHKRIKVERPSYAARNCSSCKIHHAAREGDIWAEARCFGFLWHYYACMEGNVYDITEWAGCQKDSLKHLKPDSHQVQYRIALGKQNQARRSSGAHKNEKPPDLENLLNTLYGQAEGAKKKSKKTK